MTLTDAMIVTDNRTGKHRRVHPACVLSGVERIEGGPPVMLDEPRMTIPRCAACGTRFMIADR